MKSICLVVIPVFVSIFATAQVTPVNPRDTLKPNPASDILNLTAPPAAKFMYDAPLGKVYAMAPDNMPCLVPNYTAENSMPVYKTPFTNQFIPNPIPRQQLPLVPLMNDHLLKLNKAPGKTSQNLMLDLVKPAEKKVNGYKSKN